MKPFPSPQLPWLSNPRGVQEPSHKLSATGTSPLGKEEEVLRQGVLGPPGTLRACLGKLVSGPDLHKWWTEFWGPPHRDAQ
jgi:hypothetical protein